MIHIRPQGKSRFSFRLRVLDRYVDAGESYATEESAAFAADLAKHYLREWYFIDLPRSLEGEVFAMLAHRQNIDLPSRCSVVSCLSPGVALFALENQAALDTYAEIHRPVLREWEKLRNHPDEAVRKWCNQCDAASIRLAAFTAINHEYLNTLLLSACNRLNDAAGPVRRALKMHEHISDPVLVARYEELHNIRNAIDALSVVTDELAAEIARENRSAVEALTLLEANRPSLV